MANNTIYQLSDSLKTRLLSLSQRTLTKGEIFLLSKAIADAIPLPEAVDVSVRTHNLNYRSFVMNVWSALGDYVYIPNEYLEIVYRLLDDFVSWRAAVANGTSGCMFSGDPNNFVDDVTGVLKYVNMSDFAEGSVCAANAGHMYGIFKEIISYVK